MCQGVRLRWVFRVTDLWIVLIEVMQTDERAKEKFVSEFNCYSVHKHYLFCSWNSVAYNCFESAKAKRGYTIARAGLRSPIQLKKKKFWWTLQGGSENYASLAFLFPTCNFLLHWFPFSLWLTWIFSSLISCCAWLELCNTLPVYLDANLEI